MGWGVAAWRWNSAQYAMPGGESDTRFSDGELGCSLEGLKAVPHCAHGPNGM